MSQAFASVLTAATKTAPTAVAGQQKSVVGTSKELVEWFGNAYDPILERHIGRHVVLEVQSPEGETLEYVGVFREYSSDYLEVMDVTLEDEGRTRQVDLVVPRKHAVVRHNAESTGKVTLTRDEPQPAILENPANPETQVEV